MKAQKKRENSALIKELLEETLTQNVPMTVDVENVYGLHVLPSERPRLTYARLLVYRLMTLACAGDNRALKEVLDRFMGRTPINKAEEGGGDQNYVDFLKSLDPHALIKASALPGAEDDDLAGL